jgi:hypothetical protein
MAGKSGEVNPAKKQKGQLSVTGWLAFLFFLLLPDVPNLWDQQ